MTLGSNVTLEVLKFARANFTYTWSKEGSHQLIQTNSIKPNTLTFKNIKEEDLGYYRCEVKEAGRVVLVLYRALYRHETMPGALIPVILHKVCIKEPLVGFCIYVDRI